MSVCDGADPIPQHNRPRRLSHNNVLDCTTQHTMSTLSHNHSQHCTMLCSIDTSMQHNTRLVTHTTTTIQYAHIIATHCITLCGKHNNITLNIPTHCLTWGSTTICHTPQHTIHNTCDAHDAQCNYSHTTLQHKHPHSDTMQSTSDKLQRHCATCCLLYVTDILRITHNTDAQCTTH